MVTRRHNVGLTIQGIEIVIVEFKYPENNNKNIKKSEKK